MSCLSHPHAAGGAAGRRAPPRAGVPSGLPRTGRDRAPLPAPPSRRTPAPLPLFPGSSLWRGRNRRGRAGAARLPVGREGKGGGHAGTRTPDLYRVKGTLRRSAARGDAPLTPGTRRHERCCSGRMRANSLRFPAPVTPRLRRRHRPAGSPPSSPGPARASSRRASARLISRWVRVPLPGAGGGPASPWPTPLASRGVGVWVGDGGSSGVAVGGAPGGRVRAGRPGSRVAGWPRRYAAGGGAGPPGAGAPR
jgi:hypothetical protein